MSMPAQAISPSTQRYLSEIRRYPVLTGDEERRMLAGLRERPTSAVEALVHANLSFVVRLAAEYRHLGIPFEDLLNEGNVGLIEAARRYDSARGCRFITYAIWWIRKAILRAVHEQSSIVRLSSHQIKKQRRLREMKAELAQQMGREPERSEIRRRLGSDAAQAERSGGFRVSQVSLDQPADGEGGGTLLDLLADAGQRSAEERLIQDENGRLLRSAFDILKPQERHVLGARFGLGTERALTLREIAATMGLSRERVRQIELKAKRKVREFFRSQRAGNSRAHTGGI